MDTAATTFQILFILDPVIRVWHGHIGNIKHFALEPEGVPEDLVRTIESDRSAGLALDFAGGQYVIQMRMGMDDPDDFQTHGLNRRHDQFSVSARIKNVTDSRVAITENRAVTLQGSDWKSPANNIHGFNY